MSAPGPRRLGWDEPAPSDLYDHLDADDGDDDAEQAES